MVVCYKYLLEEVKKVILGIGNDVVEIKRFEELKDNFIKRIYTEKEITASRLRPSFLAANFSVKESVSKAFGTGVRGFELKEIEVLRDELGKPYVNLYESAKKIAKDKGIKKIFVSISDTKEMVMTMAVAEGE